MAKKLTVEEAKKIAKKYLIESGLHQGEWYYLHEKSVADTAKVLGDRLKVDTDKMVIAAWVHDIGYSIEDENHGKHSLKLVEEIYELDDVLRDCILNHSGDANPKTKEGKIIQIADKISFLNTDVLIALLDENPEKIKEQDLKYIDNSLQRVLRFLKKFNDLN